MIDYIKEFATLVGYLVLVLVLVLGAITVALVGITFLTTRGEAVSPCAIDCGPDDDEPFFCMTHNCGAYEQCGKLPCPHCSYKFDADSSVFGYPVFGSDPRKAENYASHTNYNLWGGNRIDDYASGRMGWE